MGVTMAKRSYSKSANRGGPRAGCGRLDAPDPRLVGSRRANREQKMRDELSGEACKRARAAVTLPKYSWSDLS